MNVLTTRVVLRERDLAEVFDLAFRFAMVRGGRKYVKLWLIACLPCLLGCVALRLYGVDWVLVWLAAAAGLVISQIPFTLAASRLLLGDELPLGGLVRAWLAKIIGQLLVHAVVLCLLAVASIFVVPALFLGAQLVFLPEIMLLEGSSLFRAYERGARLSRNRLGTGIMVSVLLVLLLAAFALAAHVTGRAVMDDLLGIPLYTESLSQGGSLFALFGLFLAVPFATTARFLAYIDGRTRREAWDVQLRFTELAEQGGAA
jgi:hypothetical protein